MDYGWKNGIVEPAMEAPKPGKVAILGSGIGGLVAADLLSRRGYSVTVFDSRQKPGGRVMNGLPGFRVDTELAQRRVDLLRATTPPDAFNEPIESWGVIGSVWAGLEDVSDAERMRAQQVGAVVTTRIQLRYSRLSAGLTGADRIRHGADVYSIVGKKLIGRRSRVEFTAARSEDPQP